MARVDLNQHELRWLLAQVEKDFEDTRVDIMPGAGERALSLAFLSKLIEKLKTAIENPEIIPYQHMRRLEDLHLKFVIGRLRKRKQLVIKSEDFEPYEDALKVAMGPVDLTAHGFKGTDG